MSGFEVVGVLLGAIPLVVSALKSYKETKRRYIWFTNKEPYIDRLIQSLNEQIYFIRADVGVALSATDLEQQNIKAFLDDPNLNVLRDLEVAEAFRDHLGDGFQLYFDALARCQQAVCEIVKNLNGLVSGTKTIEASDLAAIVKDNPKKNGDFEFTRKIKFSLQKEDLDAQITELEASAKVLSRINKQSMRVEAVAVQSRSRTITKFATTLAMIRNSAHRLHAAISRGYVDGCHEKHEAQLFLQTRYALIQGPKLKSLKRLPVAFEVAFCVDAVTLGQGSWSYKTEVQVIEKTDDMDDIEAESQLPEIRKQPIVSFNLPDSLETTEPPVNDIQNLCSLMYSTHKQNTPLELSLSGRGGLCFIDRQTSSKHLPSQMGDPLSYVTLKQLISETTRTIPWIPFNHRIALSFNIASSVMQLHSTPWLALPLTSSSICFPSVDTHNDDKASTESNKHQPFIRAVFADCQAGCVTCRYNTGDSMLELGILLLELWHARSVEAFAVGSGLELNQSFGARYEIAREWIVQSEGDMIPFYLEAATRCIECRFATSTPRPDWSDITFQKSVCQYVLKPLLDHCPTRFR